MSVGHNEESLSLLFFFCSRIVSVKLPLLKTDGEGVLPRGDSRVDGSPIKYQAVKSKLKLAVPKNASKI